MAKREKLVYKNWSEMSHEWATNPNRNIRCNNGFVEGRVIYSYGRHFPVAKIVEQKNGRNIVYMTLDTYSSTTASHIREAKSAVSHLDKLYMLNVPKNESVAHGNNIQYWINQAEDAVQRIDKGKDRKADHLRHAEYIIKQLKLYQQHFKIRNSKEINAIVKKVQDPKWLLQIEEYNKKKAAKEEYEKEHWPEIQAKKEAAEKKKWEEDIAKWRNGEIYRLPYKYHGGVLLRYDADKDRIMTSKNVYVPVEAAKRFYNRVQKVLKQGGCSDNCNDKILDYVVKEIRTDMLVIGCHNIPMEEVEKIAKQMQW